MHDIDGFVYGNQPGLSMCVGDRVSWHIMSGILMHSPLFYGNTVTYNGKRTDAVGQIQGVEHIQKKKTNKQAQTQTCRTTTNWGEQGWRSGESARLPPMCPGFDSRTRGPFLDGPETFSHPESRGKISNLMITELFYSQILNMNRGSLYTRSFRRMRFSIVRYR